MCYKRALTRMHAFVDRAMLHVVFTAWHRSITRDTIRAAVVVTGAVAHVHVLDVSSDVMPDTSHSAHARQPLRRALFSTPHKTYSSHTARAVPAADEALVMGPLIPNNAVQHTEVTTLHAIIPTDDAIAASITSPQLGPSDAIEQHARDISAQHPRDTSQHTRDTSQHARDTSVQHIRDTSQHARDTSVQHACDTSQHTHDTSVQHTRDTSQHTRDTSQHTRDTSVQHACDTPQHTCDTSAQHTRDTSQHTRDTSVQHTRDTSQHTHDTYASSTAVMSQGDDAMSRVSTEYMSLASHGSTRDSTEHDHTSQSCGHTYRTALLQRAWRIWRRALV